MSNWWFEDKLVDAAWHDTGRTSNVEDIRQLCANCGKSLGRHSMGYNCPDESVPIGFHPTKKFSPQRNNEADFKSSNK
jgi:hypothetical protein